jgi:hypothetical protein
MPSSHSAGAIAYATAATWQTPALGAVTVPLAALVAWSRAATGRHYPTDIAAGTALGLAAGALVHLTLGRFSPGERTDASGNGPCQRPRGPGHRRRAPASAGQGAERRFEQPSHGDRPDRLATEERRT